MRVCGLHLLEACMEKIHNKRVPSAALGVPAVGNTFCITGGGEEEVNVYYERRKISIGLC